MEGPVFGLLVVVAFALVIWFMVARHNREQRRQQRIDEYRREKVECGSCRNRMTRGAFHRRGGCPRCGSDLSVPTGQRAERG